MEDKVKDTVEDTEADAATHYVDTLKTACSHFIYGPTCTFRRTQLQCLQKNKQYDMLALLSEYEVITDAQTALSAPPPPPTDALLRSQMDKRTAHASTRKRRRGDAAS